MDDFKRNDHEGGDEMAAEDMAMETCGEMMAE